MKLLAVLDNLIDAWWTSAWPGTPADDRFAIALQTLLDHEAELPDIIRGDIVCAADCWNELVKGTYNPMDFRGELSLIMVAFIKPSLALGLVEDKELA